MEWCRTRDMVLLAAVLALQAQAGSAQAVFDLHELARGVYAAEVVHDPPAYAFANSLVVIGADGVLVVDTQQSPTAARALIGEIAKLTDAPVRWVVNTHWHGDHVNGNQAYAAAYPGVEFIAHESVSRDLRTLGASRRQAELAALPASLALRREWLRNGSGPGGTALTAADRRAVSRSLALREAYSVELAQIAPPPPTRMVTDRLQLMVGAHRVQLIYLGPAHTQGDVIVYLPDLGILAAGDLLEAGLPYFEDAYPRGWQRAIARIAALRPTVIVPSHGPVARDHALLDEARRLLSMITEYAAATPDVDDPDMRRPQVWQQLEQHWGSRYGVSVSSFTATMRTAIARARLEEEAR